MPYFDDEEHSESYISGGADGPLDKAQKWLSEHSAIVIAVLIVLILLLIWWGCDCMSVNPLKRALNALFKPEGFAGEKCSVLGCGNGYAIGGKVLCMQQDDSAYDIRSIQEKAFDKCDRNQENYMVTSDNSLNVAALKGENFTSKSLSASIVAQGGPESSAAWYTLDGETAKKGLPSRYDENAAMWMPVLVQVPNNAGGLSAVYVLSATSSSAGNSAANAKIISNALAAQKSLSMQKMLGCPDLSNMGVQRDYAERANAHQWQVKQMMSPTNAANAPAFLNPHALKKEGYSNSFPTSNSLAAKLY